MNILKRIVLGFAALVVIFPSMISLAADPIKLPTPTYDEEKENIDATVKDIQAREDYQRKYNECTASNPISNNPDNAQYCECVANGGVKLNTNVPFIGRCINKDNSAAQGSTTSTAFGDLIGGLSKMVVTAILIVSFMMIIIGGVMRTSGNAKGGRALIIKVVIGLALLGASGAILRLINPNFFK